ncbi:MAG: hypothetical protein BWX96_03146 [Bacteroidetes bacterium ADurb.Bin145]|jgi:hypothetical protein|nr:lasso peptide biosynthesis B2 protein [Bacteroidales bacterium]OQB57616.1 MAG: hypothetical protein BWX96_03146 [Bacteroidetes bacterium ADurb.Bin145]HOC49234.1 lasso peptide biosynthesis B2 protein [Bacteroidales bacterium]HOR10435.1 lasso peptide biosynthesis B2 protein [Bacteroidales bacterium]HQM70332.1 lasso peptide biosynthesis B2 protein [Bacteroidales bacterium]
MLGRFFRISGRERRLFLEALALQLWVGLLLKVIPFRRIPGLFWDRVQDSEFRVKGSKNQESEVRNQEQKALFLLKAATQRASKVSPWKNKCLVSSLAARCMLRHRRITSQISMGLARTADNKTIAHAWINAGEFEIVEKRDDYTELYRF